MPIVSFGQRFLDPKDEVAFLRQQLEGMMRERAAMSQRPLARATVIARQGPKSVIAVGNQIMEVMTPNFAVEPAQTVHIHPETHAIVDIIDEPFLMGVTCKVDRVIDDKHLVLANVPPLGPKVVIFRGTPPKPGDSVVLDPCQVIVVKNLGAAQPAAGPPRETGVSWDDIRGQDEAVAALRDAIEGPVVDKALRARYGRKPAKGALLAGPPGCGKTLLGAACATALATLHGKEGAASGYQYVKGPELLNHMLGQSEANVRRLFQNARAHYAEHGYPCVVFLDEADALLGRRDVGILQTMNQTIVPMFLTEMDGLDASCAFVLVATNRPDMLDSAVTREGRLDLKIEIGRPDHDGIVSTLERYLRVVPLDGMTLAQACERGADEIESTRHVLYMVRTKSGKGDRRFELSDVVSGAMCAGLVARAVDSAISRDRESGEATGVRAADLAAAADRLCAEQLLLDHTADLQLFLKPLGEDVKSVEKAKS
jgi:AAA+ superfamily predicted ATPase